MKTATEFLATKDKEWFPFDNYKTFATYCTGGKLVFPGNKQAMVLYEEILATDPELLAIIDIEDAYFFQKQPISVHTLLRSVSLVEQLDPPLKVNLARKAFAVWAKLNKTTEHQGESASDLFAKVARMDKHRFSTADKIYGAITPEEDAKLAKH